MLKAELIKKNIPEEKLEAIDVAAKEEAKKSVEFAAASPEPELAELARDVYTNPWADNLLPKVEIPH